MYGQKSILQFSALRIAMAVLQTFRWRCAECAIHHEWNVREEQHPYISGANKQ